MNTMEIKQLAVGPMMNFAYLVADPSAGICAAVDPGWDAEGIVKAADKMGWDIKVILLTHTHFDHSQEVTALFRATKAGVFVHKNEVLEISRGHFDVNETEEGTRLKIGGQEVTCMHTPGHSPGSQCFLAGDSIITGDTLFVGGCGRVDLPGSNPKEMLASLKRIARLDPRLTVYPGHDYGPAKVSTIADEIRQNPYLTSSSENLLL